MSNFSDRLSIVLNGDRDIAVNFMFISCIVLLLWDLCSDRFLRQPQATVAECNLASFCQQDYPEYQIVFAVRDRQDPSIEVVRKIIHQFVYVDIQSEWLCFASLAQR